MSEHSSIVGGSTAGRLIECPGSFQSILSLPPSIDRPSEYAEEGTAMHAVMAYVMERRMREPTTAMITLATMSIGNEFYDRVLTSAHIHEMIAPAIRALAELETFYGGGFEVVGVERRVAFPGVPGAFGTVDVILRNANHVLHVDWKFGSGVPVQAVYATPDGDYVNAQLLFYVTAARASVRSVYRGKPTLVGCIIQPRGDTPLTHTEISPSELKMFRQDVEHAVVTALGPNPPRVKGEHCRFAPCKVICPLWTGPLLDLTALGKLPVPAADHSDATAYGQYLAHAKPLVDMLAMFKKDIDEQMHSFLESGGAIPGWRLKAKAKQRQWVDDKTVETALKKLGFKVADIYERRLVTFKSADATAKHLGVEIPEHLRVAPPTSETTIATVDDPAPVVNRAATIEKFQASLKQLEQSSGQVYRR